MDIRKLDVSEITFSDPDPINNELHLCPAKMPTGDAISLTLAHVFSIVDINEEKISINMDNKEIVRALKNIQDVCIDKIFNNSKEWFEDNIQFEDVKDNFESFVHPNIEENCIVFEINTVGKDLDSLEKGSMIKNIIMEFAGVTFNGSKFKMLFKLSDFDKHVHVDTVNDVEEEEEEEKVETPVEQPSNNEENKVEEEVINLDDDIEEVNIEPESIVESNDMKMNFEKDNLFMVYDIINEKLKSSLLFNLQEVFESKKINIDDFDLEEIMFEDEYSDDESDDSENYYA